MSMNINEEEFKAWWDEVDRLVSEMTIPCVPMPKPEPVVIAEIIQPKWISGNVYYTLADDRQFAVDADHPQATGWNYE